MSKAKILIVPLVLIVSGCAQYHTRYPGTPEEYGVMYKFCSTDIAYINGGRISAIVSDYKEHFVVTLSTGWVFDSPKLTDIGILYARDIDGTSYSKMASRKFRINPGAKKNNAMPEFSIDCSNPMLIQRVNASGRPVN